MILLQKLHFLIENNYNVLFEGKHGVGKTSIVKEVFEAHKLKWRYFSAATLDPWVDFVGVPKEKTDGKNSYLELIRPQGLDDLEALFFDEFNRSHKKVRNAVMELMQFKSINGKPLPKLRFIWAAINPEDGGEYQVEPIDPAQVDRFHAKIPIPYKCDPSYFTKKYGQANAQAAISWWNGLPAPMKDLVSPRRLDYALDFHSKNGDLRDVLPDASNVSKLLTTLKVGPINEILIKFFAADDKDGARAWIAIENNFAAAMSTMMESKYKLFFVPLWPKEKIIATAASNLGFLQWVLKHSHLFSEIIVDVYKASQSKTIKKHIQEAANKLPDLQALLTGKIVGSMPEAPYWNKHLKQANRPQYVNNTIPQMDKNQTQWRMNAYSNLINDCLPEILNVSDAIDILRFLNALAHSSHVKTLENLPHFMGVVNHALESSRLDITNPSFQALNRKIKLSNKLSEALSCEKKEKTKAWIPTRPLKKKLPMLKRRGRPSKKAAVSKYQKQVI